MPRRDHDILNKNIAKGTTDPGVDCFDQKFWFGRLVRWVWLGRFGLVGLVW